MRRRRAGARPVPRPTRRRPTDLAVSTIIVNHERRDLLRACLESLQAALARVEDETELIVVDNGSR